MGLVFPPNFKLKMRSTASLFLTRAASRSLLSSQKTVALQQVDFRRCNKLAGSFLHSSTIYIRPSRAIYMNLCCRSPREPSVALIVSARSSAAYQIPRRTRGITSLCWRRPNSTTSSRYLFNIATTIPSISSMATSHALSSSTHTNLPASIGAASYTNGMALTNDESYKPFLTRSAKSEATLRSESASDWVEELELDTVTSLASSFGRKLKILVLYGSLRERSFSRLTAYEASRILHRIGVEVRIFNPQNLPIKDEISVDDPKVKELRSLSEWSDGQLWVSPEQHGTITAVMKNQIDWIPLSVGSVRPTQGRTLAVCQVNGGSQSFNTVNQLRQLGRWMRMWTIPNQSSIPMAWKCFTPDDRLMPSSNRDRLVDVCEELVKATILLQPHKGLLDDRYSERKERLAHGRLRTQAEAEAAKLKTEEEQRSLLEISKKECWRWREMMPKKVRLQKETDKRWREELVK